jgi:archaellum component FlaG (FlaF/FlaG flagellin family)
VTCVMVTISFLCGMSMSESTETIAGRVNDNYQIVTDDGNIYDVEGNEKGDEIANLVGKRVRATGTVDESENMKIILINSYEVIGRKGFTIVGTVNDSYQIVTDDGDIYTVEESEKGNEVIVLIGKQVKATGMVEENEDIRAITISSYEVIGE